MVAMVSSGTLADPLIVVPCPPAWGTTHVAAVASVPSRAMTTTEQGSPGGSPVAISAMRTQPAAGVTTAAAPICPLLPVTSRPGGWSARRGGGGDDDARGARPPGQRAPGADDDQQDGRRGEQPGTAATVTAALLRTDAAQGAVQAELAGGVCVWGAVEEQLGRNRVDARRGFAELGELFPRGRALLEVVADRLLLVAVELAQTVGQQVGVVVLTGPGHVWSPSAGGFIAARRARSAW